MPHNNCGSNLHENQHLQGESLKDSDMPSFEGFTRLFQHEFGSQKLSSAVSENPALLAMLRQHHPIKTAITFAGLLTQKRLQSNCLRLEVLVHLSLACCQGDKTPVARFTSHAFKAVGRDTHGRMEDPAEDVFVSSVHTPRGNYRVLVSLSPKSGH
jgi:hypothetical protein